MCSSTVSGRIVRNTTGTSEPWFVETNFSRKAVHFQMYPGRGNKVCNKCKDFFYVQKVEYNSLFNKK